MIPKLFKQLQNKKPQSHIWKITIFSNDSNKKKIFLIITLNNNQLNITL